METPLLNLFSNKTTPVVIIANPKSRQVITALLDKTTGAPKVDARNESLGSIRLQQENTSMNGTFMNVRNRVSFITSTIANLEKLVKAHDLKDGSVIGGKILIEESLIAFYKNQPSKIVPAPENSSDAPRRIGITIQNRFYPVFMQMRYVEDEKLEDSLIRTPQELMKWLENNKGLVDVNELGEVTSSSTPNVPINEGGKIPAITT